MPVVTLQKKFCGKDRPLQLGQQSCVTVFLGACVTVIGGQLTNTQYTKAT